MSTILGTLAAGLKSKADALDSEVSAAFAAQHVADEAHSDYKSEIYAELEKQRDAENTQKINEKNATFTSAKEAKEAELAALIGISTNPGSLSPTTVFSAINQLAIENAGWNAYQDNQAEAAMIELTTYESETLGFSADFVAAVGY